MRSAYWKKGASSRGALIKFFFMIVEVTGLRRLENGLVVAGKFMAFTKGAVIGQQLKEQVMHRGPSHQMSIMNK